MRGRCLPYGEGITYWPVVEVVKQLAVLPSDPVAAAAIRSLLGESDRRDERGRDRLGVPQAARGAGAAGSGVRRHAVGRGDVPRSGRVDGAALDRSTAAAPVHGAAGAGRASPRLAGHAAAGAARPGAGRRADRRRRARRSSASGSRTRRAATRSSSPRCSRWRPRMPRSRCLRRSRRCWRCASTNSTTPSVGCSTAGSVEGEIFHRGAVQASLRRNAGHDPLAALVRHQLVRPDRAQLAGDDGYRFRHLLIRDTAYDALPKAVRADLHARFADWLDEHGRDLVELRRDRRLPPRAGRPLPRRARTTGPVLAERPVIVSPLRVGALSGAETGVRPPRCLRGRSRLTRPLRLDVHLEVDLAVVGDAEQRAAIAEGAAERAAADGDEQGPRLPARSPPRCAELASTSP